LPDGSLLPPLTKFTRRLPPGTIVRVETAGGGGFGDPAGRPGARQADDLADGLISRREEP
jgi:N-methylhydantoinase B